ncbi:MAG TPA: hypothetical protein VJC08_05485 [bacterium]|nr:hypothetical protein [bacterium]
MIYTAGRLLQLIGLLAMPSAFWLAQFAHDERGSIGFFLGSLLVFWLGYLLTQVARK